MPKSILVCDLDNTLYDWVGYFVPAFYAMVDEVVRITGCERGRLLDEFQQVHKFYHDSEHPFALLELPTIQKLFQGRSRKEVASALNNAFYAFNATRKRELKLYPGTSEALADLRRLGVLLIAHTESNLYAALDRLGRLHLIELFHRIYCRERAQSLHPDPDAADSWLRRFPMEKVVELSRHQRKPDADVLIEICAREGVATRDAAYVGDSMARDILMAKRAGVFAVWAKYGAIHTEEEYKKLVRITHWSHEDVEREKGLKKEASGIDPDFILEHRFDEILSIWSADAIYKAATG